MLDIGDRRKGNSRWFEAGKRGRPTEGSGETVWDRTQDNRHDPHIEKGLGLRISQSFRVCCCSSSSYHVEAARTRGIS